MISLEDYLWFVDVALDGMVGIVEQLGDDLVNEQPDLPGANSAYAIVTHCLGVMDYWAGHVAAGRSIDRHRDAEFWATGQVHDLIDRVRVAREQLERDLAAVEPSAAPRAVLEPEDADLPLGRTQGGALFHVYEELAQHHGHLELTRDLVLASNRPDRGA